MPIETSDFHLRSIKPYGKIVCVCNYMYMVDTSYCETYDNQAITIQLRYGNESCNDTWMTANHARTLTSKLLFFTLTHKSWHMLHYEIHKYANPFLLIFLDYDSFKKLLLKVVVLKMGNTFPRYRFIENSALLHIYIFTMFFTHRGKNK